MYVTMAEEDKLHCVDHIPVSGEKETIYSLKVRTSIGMAPTPTLEHLLRPFTTRSFLLTIHHTTI